MFGDLNIANGYQWLRIKFPVKASHTDSKRAESQNTWIEEDMMGLKVLKINIAVESLNKSINTKRGRSYTADPCTF